IAVVSLALVSYFQPFTAFSADSASRGCPPTYSRRRTEPSGLIQIFSLTLPCRAILSAIAGYSGSSRRTSLRSGSAASALLPSSVTQSKMCFSFVMLNVVRPKCRSSMVGGRSSFAIHHSLSQPLLKRQPQRELHQPGILRPAHLSERRSIGDVAI